MRVTRGSLLLALTLACGACPNGVPPVAPLPQPTPALLAFADTVQRRTFDWFWQTTNPANGLVPDRWPTQSFSRRRSGSSTRQRRHDMPIAAALARAGQGPGAQEAWTKTLWVYDLRTNKHFTLKTRRLTRADLDDFVSCYRPEDRHNRKPTWSEASPEGRWRPFNYDDIVGRDKAAWTSSGCAMRASRTLPAFLSRTSSPRKSRMISGRLSPRSRTSSVISSSASRLRVVRAPTHPDLPAARLDRSRVPAGPH